MREHGRSVGFPMQSWPGSTEVLCLVRVTKLLLMEEAVVCGSSGLGLSSQNDLLLSLSLFAVLRLFALFLPYRLVSAF